MRKPKVLMLGWEFPPVINGGLGVACLGLSRALSAYADLTVILPKSSPDFRVNNVELIGLNNLDVDELRRSSSSSVLYQGFSEKVSEIPVDVLPYSSTLYDTLVTQEKMKALQEDVETVDNVRLKNIFKSGELYGADVHEKVYEFARQAKLLAAQKDFDVIHCHDWMTIPAGLEVQAMTGKPLVLHVHSLEYDRAGAHSRSWVYEIERLGMHSADMVIPVSYYTGSIAQHHYGVDPAKIVAIHNGTDPVVPFKAEKHFPEDLVLFLGRITEQKGPEFFLEVADQVVKTNPNVRFVMAGTGDRLKSLIEGGAYRQIGHKFHFTGFLNKEKVHNLYAMSDVYCMPSVSEPFGLSALEAAQFGVPCVISKQSGVAEVLNGSLKADFWDVKKMGEHISSLLEDKSLKESLIKEANKNLLDCTWEKAAEKVRHVYDYV
ncbi:glycosyltransferase [Cytophagaceae bacterium ABcell3]|nr:glycosyltransferase [Cytophagaceae bacterium ABcell3]